jgi:hypothetical protein
MKTRLAMALFFLVLGGPRLFAQDPLDGLWQGYDGEWRHVSRELTALAEATPPDKFGWRPKSTCTSSSRTSTC